MPSLAELRGPHPCLDRACGHPDTEHLRTPELAGPFEVIVWCAACRRHEMRRQRTWFRRGARDERSLRSLPGVGRAI